MNWFSPKRSRRRDRKYQRRIQQRTQRRIQRQLEPLEPRQLLAAVPVITELVARNDGSLLDGDGNRSDWIEIYNDGDESLNLEAWYLTDDADDLGKWPFPNVQLAPGQFLTVFASGQSVDDYVDVGGNLHTNFQLNGEGEYLALVQADGVTVASEYSPSYPNLGDDESFGYGMGQEITELVTLETAGAVLVPDSDDDQQIGNSWTGAAADEPFDDSAAAGWTHGNSGYGFDTQDGGVPLGTYEEEVLADQPLAYYQLEDTLSSSAPIPIGYWTFEDDFSDLTLNANHGTPGGNVDFSNDVPGGTGSSRSLTLDGSGDFVDLPINDINPFDGSGQFTITTWFKSLGSGNRIILSSARGTVNNDHAMAFFLHGGNNGNLRQDNFFVNQVNRGTNLHDGQWHFGAIVYSGGTHSMYMDDTNNASSQGFNPNIPNIQADTVRVGDSLNTTFPAPGDWNGMIDNLAIFNRALTPAELAQVKIGNVNLGGGPGVDPAHDSSGQGKHGTYSASGVIPSVVSAGDSLGQAMDFRGGNVQIPDLGSHAQVSIEAWIAPDVVPGGGELASIYSSDGSGAGSTDLRLGNASAVQLDITDAGNVSASGIQAGSWQHVVSTYDSVEGEVRTYIDGVLAGTQSVTAGVSARLDEGRIGAWFDGVVGQQFDGRIDELAVYDKVLSPSRISAHYNSLLDLQSGLIGYWSFDGSYDDLSGNGYHGNAAGDASFSADTPRPGGQSLALDGSGDYVDLPINAVNPFDGSSDFTIGTWFRVPPQSSGNFNRVILSSARGTTSSDHAMAFFIATTGGSTGGAADDLRVDNFFVSEHHIGNGLDDDQWHYGAATYRAAGNTFQMYLDGSFGGTKTFNPAIPNVQLDTVRIGDTLNTTFPAPGDFQGWLDDVVIYDRALSASELDALRDGQLVPRGFHEDIRTDVETAMHGVNSSAYLRIPFDIGDANTLTTFDSLTLRMKYDDAFIAYLNGVEVARRNAPGAVGTPAAYNAAAIAEQADAQALRYESLNLSAHLDELRLGTNVLALHGLNTTADDDDFLLVPELDAAGITLTADVGVLVDTTPSAPNSLVVSERPSLSVPGGTFSGSLSVELTAADPNALIYYTTDGSPPSTVSTQYGGPLNLTSTTQVRAIAVQDGRTPSPVVGAGYIRLANDVTGFSSDLPLIILENFGGVAPNQSVLSDFHMTVLEPREDGRTRLTDSAEVNTRLGIKIRGQSSSGFAEKQYRIETRDQTDGDIDYALLGLPADSDWVLNGPFTDKALIRNSFSFDLGREIGLEAPRTRHVEVYLNQNGGDLQSADYVGVYILMESIKRGNDRVDIPVLDAGDISEPEISGGYLFRSEGTVTVAADSLIGWNEMELVNRSDYTQSQLEWISTHLTEATAALRGPDSTDPVLGYAKYFDADSFVNTLVINELTRDQDAYRRSAYFHKDREGKIVSGPMWDYNLVMGTGCCFNNRDTFGWQYAQPYNAGEHRWYLDLLRDPEFAQRFEDRWQELRQGPLSLEDLFARIDAHANPLQESQARNFVKWNNLQSGNVGFPTPSTQTWEQQVDFIKNWLTARVQWIDSQFLTAPVFAPDAGVVAFDTELVMSASGSIYYTTDGSDPRLPLGVMNPDAMRYENPIPLTQNTRFKARTFVGGDWSGMTDAQYVVDGVPASSDSLVVSEVMYNPADPDAAELAAGFTNGDDFEFLELQNISNSSIDLAGVRLIELDGDGIEFDFTNSQVSALEPGQHVLVVKDLAAFSERYDADGLLIAGEYDRRLGDGGELVTVVDAQDQIIQAFEYDDRDPWSEVADGLGFSLVLIEPLSNPDHDLAGSWRPSGVLGGTPGEAAPTRPETVLVNEVLSHTDLPLSDSIELLNVSGEAVDISGWFLSDSNDLAKFTIPAGTILQPGDYIVFDEDDFNPTPLNPGPDDFALNSAQGDDVWLTAADAQGNVLWVADHVEFGAQANGESWGRWPNGDGRLYPMTALTLNAENSGPRVGPLVISEIMYNAPDPDLPGQGIDPSNLEFVEVYNPTAAAVDLTNWEISGGVDLTFAAGTMIQADERLVIVSFDPEDPLNNTLLADFNSFHEIDATARLIGGYSGQLDNGGERIRLMRPDEPPVDDPDFIPALLEDEVIYDDAAPWPAEADSLGFSLTRISAELFGNDSASWIAVPPTPGEVIEGPPTVVQLTVNGGITEPRDRDGEPQPSSWLRQRSDIRTLVVTFSSLITADESAFAPTSLGLNAPVDLDEEIELTAEHVRVEGNRAILQFGHTELPVGVYKLDVHPTVENLDGEMLDGNGDGVAGDGYSITGSQDNGLYLLTVDFNGDRGVSIFDFGTFAYWFGLTAGPGEPAPSYVDLNNDGGVSIFDFGVFAANFQRSVNFPVALADVAALPPRLPATAQLQNGVEQNEFDLESQQRVPFAADTLPEFVQRRGLPKVPTTRPRQDDLESILNEISSDVASGWHDPAG